MRSLGDESPMVLSPLPLHFVPAAEAEDEAEQDNFTSS